VSPRSLALDDRLYAYYRAVGLREHPSLAALREATDALPDGSMRSSTEQALLLAFLVELTGAARVLEVGCFTGYGTLAMALALPPDGRVVTLDANHDWPAIGRKHREEAGVASRIDLRVGLAEDAMRHLLAETGPASFDLVYVDADKKRYATYYELALSLTRPGGIVALDNVCGRAASPTPTTTLDRPRPCAPSTPASTPTSA
jgi:O-methyltransferase